ncbi:hypothetical protein McanMca71_007915 [Microsporum canis]
MEDWMTSPPYVNQTEEQFGDIQWQAQCQCQRVRYEISRKQPLDAKFCHCRGCQILHGAPFQWAAIFEKSDIRFVSGHGWLDFYNSSSKEQGHNLPCKVSCSYCHSLIMDEGRHVILLFPELIRNDAEADGDKMRRMFYPSCHVFYEQRVVDIPDGRPKWKGMNGTSELMED